MTLRTSTFALLSLTLLLPLGCEKAPEGAAGAASAASPVASTQTTPTPEATPDKKGKRGKRGMRGGGVVHALYNAALNDIGLPAEKVAELEKLQPERKRDESRMEAAKSRQAAMIAGIEAGKLDSAKVDEDKSAMEKKMAEQKEAQQKLLGDLHAALDPAQRKAAVDAVKKQHAARDERMAQKKAEGDKAEGDKAVEDGDSKKGKGFARKGRGGRGGPGGRAGRGGGMFHGGNFGFDRMLGRLDLDDAQQKKVEAIKAKMESERPSETELQAKRDAMKKTSDAVLAAFEKDTFDPKTLELSPARKAPDTKKHVAHANELLAVLTADQRTKLAEQMKRMGEMRGGRGGRGARGRGGPGGKGGPMGGPPGEPMDDGLDAFDDMGDDWDSDGE